MTEPQTRGEMPFLDHLEELRWRLLYSLLAIVLCTIAGWFVVSGIDIIGVLVRPIEPLLPGGRLAFTSPVDPLMIQLKFAFLVGLVLASPVVGYNLWAFLAPALYDREKRMIVPSLVVGALLFLVGALAGYALVLPRALKVLFGFQSAHLAPVITADRYFGFAFQLILAFGVVTELPLVVTILASLGLVTPAFLRRNRRYALVVAAALAAFLTPPDAVSMLMMMVPLLLLYEIGILCAWVVTRRRAREAQGGEGGEGTGRSAVKVGLILLALALAHPGVGRAQGVGGQPPDTTQRPGGAGFGTGGQATPTHPLDTAAARKLGLPSAPTRSFPASDSIIDSLLRLKGYRITQYVADTLVLVGDSQTIMLRGAAFVDREGTKLEADSIRYHQADCRLDATGSPQLFDQGSVMVGEGMRYDTCEKRGTVREALTDFQNGGATWLMRGNLAVDSGSTRLYGAKSNITSSDLPVPDYHFEARQVKWVNKTVMVARPAILYVRDVPIIWLPFIFQDIRPGRRSGILIPRFGLNDIVRPTRTYHRHISNFGYYWVINDYVDALASADWFAGTSFTVRAQTRYRWLSQFVSGGFSYSHLGQLDTPATSDQIMWNHVQQFSSRTRFSAAVNYATNGRVVQNNTVDPWLTTAQLSSTANFDKRFDWGAFNAGATLTQNLSTKLTTQNFPRVTLTPAPIDIGTSITWSPGFSFNNAQTLHNGPTLLLTGDGTGTVDTSALFFDSHQTDIGLRTPFRIGRWNWDNSIAITDRSSNQRLELAIPDSTDPGRLTTVVYGRTFATALDWTTGINLPQLFSGTWHLQPSVSIINTTSAGPFLIRNQFSGGHFVSQGKRLAFGLGLAPTFFGFFPGIGPLARIRHSISPLISYQLAPGAKVPEDYVRAIDPTGRLLNSHSDPQQTMNVGLQQNFEGKFRPPEGDTTTAAASRKIRLLSWTTSPMSYNFEQAKQPGRTGWQTQTMTNTFASDLLRGFSLQLTHDLWTGQAGLATSHFSPFLTNTSASFTVTARTFQGLAALVGLGHIGNEPPAPQAQPAQPGVLPGQVPQGPGPRGRVDLQGPYVPGAGAGGGFSMSLQYTSSRTRVYSTTAPPPVDIGLGPPPPPPIPPPTTGLSGGRSQLSMNTRFNPTVNWSVSWNTIYDFDLRQFGQQYVRLERNLRRWHASFVFSRTASGNFAFNFYVALLDEPDIKFDYDQQSFVK